VPRRAIGAASSHPRAVRRFASSHHADAAGMSRRKLRFLLSMRLIRRPVRRQRNEPLRIRAYAIDDEKDVIALWVTCGLVVPQNNPKRDIERKLRVNPDWFLSVS